MRDYKIAATIIEKTIPEMLIWAEETISQGANFPEFRLDSLNLDELLMEDGKVNVLRIKNLTREFPEAIYTNRHPNETLLNSEQGFKGTEEQRIAVLQTVADLEVKYIDVEHRYFKVDSPPLRTNPKRTFMIRSYHDFDKTPPFEELQKIYYEIDNSFGADIVKIATMTQKLGDAETIIELIKAHAYSRGLIAIAMGEIGKETRFEGPIWRSFLTYGSINGKAAAPGMPSIRELRKYAREQNF